MAYSLAIDSPVGRLTITATEDAIVAIDWGDQAGGEPAPLVVEACRQLEAYFDRRLSHFDLPLQPAGSSFDQQVWAAMQRIPRGETRRYGELAMEVGSAPRAVGGACGRNPIPIVIPCHRVLARNGLGGYSGGAGLATKRVLLALEGAAALGHAGRVGAAHSAAFPGVEPKAEYVGLFRPTSS
ncbi:MAG: methylated-DNA--[protein]-cysteine S-methyltransferase [Stellaceae bacterium]